MDRLKYEVDLPAPVANQVALEVACYTENERLLLKLLEHTLNRLVELEADHKGLRVVERVLNVTQKVRGKAVAAD